MDVLTTQLNVLHRLSCDGAVIVTANLRLARRLNRELDVLTSQNSASLAWPAARIVTFDQWLKQRFETAMFAGTADVTRTMSSQQALSLWQQAILKEGEPKAVVLASAAQKAHQLLVQYQVAWTKASGEFNWGVDSAAFARWRKNYLELRKNQRTLLEQGAELLNANAGSRDECLVYAGFAKLTPLQEALFDKFSLHQQSFFWASDESSRQGETKTTHSFPQFEDELDAALNWAAKASTTHPAGSYAIVLQDLHQQMAVVTRALRSDTHVDLQAELSAGQALSQTAMGQAALIALQASQDKLNLAQWQQLIRSKYLATAQFSHLTVPWLNALHRSLKSELSLSDASYLLSKKHSDQVDTDTSVDESALNEGTSANTTVWQWSDVLIQTRKTVKLKQTPKNWAVDLRVLLEAWGWPGCHSLDSYEYQLKQRFDQTFQLFADFDRVEQSMNYKEAVRLLGRLLSAEVFQPQSVAAPIQILGGLEASGQVFDGIWLMGMSDLAWPAKTMTSPFIPINIQRDYLMPGAAREFEYSYHQRLSEGYINACGELNVSYVRFADEAQLSLSPLFHSATSEEIEHAAKPVVGINADFEVVDDSQGIALPEAIAGESTPGGSRALEAQAQCGFQAYARHRLSLRELPEPAVALTAMERGLFLHKALDVFWANYEGHQALLKSSPVLRSMHINSAVATALDGLSSDRRRALHHTHLELEELRLRELLDAWLAVEEQRSAFTVSEREQKVELTLGERQWSLRIDRVDQLASGGYAIIDYKTGNVSAGKTVGKSPSQPQLAMYLNAVDAPEHVVALVLAQLKSVEELKLVGVAQEPLGSKDVKAPDKNVKGESWLELSERLTRWISDLSASYAEGMAAIAPFDSDACKYCEFSALCRIDVQEIDHAAG